MGQTGNTTDTVPDNSAWLTDATGGQIPIRGVCSLGRGPANQVSMPDDRVSRHHAVIEAQGDGEYWLVDLGSRNGTYLNDRRIGHPAVLRNGDAISIGPFTFVFQQVRSGVSGTDNQMPADETVVEFRVTTCWLLVADIIGSTRFVRELAPEVLGRLTGQWLKNCQALVEESGGVINQFLGDGLFGYWYDSGGVEQGIERTLHALRRLQDEARPAFRMVLHHGRVTIGGTALGEQERVSGLAVHFAFRMERLAAKLSMPRVLSAAAAERLSGRLAGQTLGRHVISGFDGEFAFYAF